MKLYMVFDVESMGLHGEGFSVGYVVVDETGKELEAGYCGCLPSNCLEVFNGDMKWVEKNIPKRMPTCSEPFLVRQYFWEQWENWRLKGAMLFADCLWPVEARFLIDCVEDNLEIRNWHGPYPFYDVGSILFALGRDGCAKYPRLENELPEHDPVCDARQSARILIESLSGK